MSIAIFASGEGSNFENIYTYSCLHKWKNPITLLFSNKPNAPVINRAYQLGVPTFSCEPNQFVTTEAYEKYILDILQRYHVEWIILAGYMRMIRTTLLHAYKSRIINIHPSLLPAFPGRCAIEEAYAYPVKISGVTIHFVDEGMDTGPIIAQAAVFLTPEDTLSTFKKKIQEVEHQLYPQVIENITQKKEENIYETPCVT